MAQENGNKIKLLKLLEILRQESDEDHPISRRALCERIRREGIKCDIRTLSLDIQTLNRFGFEVMSVKVAHEKFYYVADRSFEVPELKILIDAVQAASFITEKKSKELIAKIAALGGSHQASIMQSKSSFPIIFGSFHWSTSGFIRWSILIMIGTSMLNMVPRIL